MQIHFPLSVCVDTSHYMQIHLQALDACRHKQIHDMTSPNACWYVLSLGHMQSHAKPSLIHDKIWRQQHWSECTSTNADTCSAFDKGQLVLEHAELFIRAETCTSITGSWIVKKHANTCPALNTGQHTESWQNLQKRWDMHIHAQLLILAHTWWYEPTHAGTCQALDTWHVYTRSALDTGQLIRYSVSSRWMQKDAERCSKHAQHMQTHSQLSIRSNAYSHTLSPQCVQTHAETCHALKKRKLLQIHARLLIRADTCSHALHSWCRQTSKDIRSALNMCRYMHTRTQLSRHMQTHSQRSTQETKWRYTHSSRHRKMNEDTRSALEICQQMLSPRATCRHTLSSKCKPTNADTYSCLDMSQQHADTCSALDTSRHMQKHAKLGIRAYTCMPSERACTCIVPIHADAHRHTLLTDAE
jgi:hypothetical protein